MEEEEGPAAAAVLGLTDPEVASYVSTIAVRAGPPIDSCFLFFNSLPLVAASAPS
jgi:hypothetical protein